MNKTKRGLQLAAGIVGIVGAAILLISSIYTMIFFGALFEGVSADEAGVALLMVSLALVAALSVAILVICAMLCRNPEQDGKVRDFKGLTIAALVLNLFLVISYIISFSFYILIPLTVSGLLIAVLCLKHPANQPAPAQTAPQIEEKEE
ncbi:MAG: hypothetical protein IJ959_00235, partial [Clostridia bacterium]|nr:hypothetical protein [Clostridia bacterium]